MLASAVRWSQGPACLLRQRAAWPLSNAVSTLLRLLSPHLPQELFDEYQRALRLPGTPIKTFRLRLFLFPAAEDPFTSEELAYLSTSRSSSADKLGRDAAAAAAASLAPQPGSKEGSLARAFARAAGPGAHTRTPSSFSSELSCSSAPEASAAGAGGSPDGTATTSAGDTELAWEAGFRAGQQAALAAQEEWQALVAKRMQYLGHVQSDYILSAADAALGATHGWPEVRWGTGRPRLLKCNPASGWAGAPTCVIRCVLRALRLSAVSEHPQTLSQPGISHQQAPHRGTLTDDMFTFPPAGRQRRRLALGSPTQRAPGQQLAVRWGRGRP